MREFPFLISTSPSSYTIPLGTEHKCPRQIAFLLRGEYEISWQLVVVESIIGTFFWSDQQQQL